MEVMLSLMVTIRYGHIVTILIRQIGIILLYPKAIKALKDYEGTIKNQKAD